MKYARKCPLCNRVATKRFGKLDFCDDHYKDVKKPAGRKHRRATGIWVEQYVWTLGPECKVYRDRLVKIH